VRPAPAFEGRAAFGELAHYHTLADVRALIQALPPSHRQRPAAAAYGLTLVAAPLARPHSFFHEAEELLRQLTQAKADLDAAADHEPAVTETTEQLREAARQLMDEVTIGCTEWPTTQKLFAAVYAQAVSRLGPG